MKKLLQLIKDFRKWREEKYNEALREVCNKIANDNRLDRSSPWNDYYHGLRYGIEHREEILKKVKI